MGVVNYNVLLHWILPPLIGSNGAVVSLNLHAVLNMPISIYEFSLRLNERVKFAFILIVKAKKCKLRNQLVLLVQNTFCALLTITVLLYMCLLYN